MKEKNQAFILFPYVNSTIVDAGSFPFIEVSQSAEEGGMDEQEHQHFAISVPMNSRSRHSPSTATDIATERPPGAMALLTRTSSLWNQLLTYKTHSGQRNMLNLTMRTQSADF